jgi:hypothetical protein
MTSEVRPGQQVTRTMGWGVGEPEQWEWVDKWNVTVPEELRMVASGIAGTLECLDALAQLALGGGSF